MSRPMPDHKATKAIVQAIKRGTKKASKAAERNIGSTYEVCGQIARLPIS